MIIDPELLHIPKDYMEPDGYDMLTVSLPYYGRTTKRSINRFRRPTCTKV